MRTLSVDELRTLANLARLPEGRAFVSLLKSNLSDTDIKSRRLSGDELMRSLGCAVALEELILALETAQDKVAKLSNQANGAVGRKPVSYADDTLP